MLVLEAGPFLHYSGNSVYFDCYSNHDVFFCFILLCSACYILFIIVLSIHARGYTDTNLRVTRLHILLLTFAMTHIL